MDFIMENRRTAITAECDVLVAGGGIAGISAALAAARAGAKVTLLERGFMFVTVDELACAFGLEMQPSVVYWSVRPGESSLDR